VTQAKIVFVHIPKTAGTAVRIAFEKAASHRLRVSPHFDERHIAEIDPAKFDFFSGHLGFKAASELGNQLLTVVRNPVDRFVSQYYFVRALHTVGRDNSIKAALATKYPLNEFVKIKDDPSLLDFYNMMTWQIAHGTSLERRRELRMMGKTDADVLQLALNNLETFSLVGVQERLEQFAQSLGEMYSVSLRINKVNVSRTRPELAEISTSTIDAIREWSELDLVLYARADALVSEAMANRKSA
jgi:hypothetical protein